MATKKKATFEQSMQALEEIVKTLEQGDVPLEQSLSLFEEGVALSAKLQQILQTAEQKVSILTQTPDGIAEQPWEETDT